MITAVTTEEFSRNFEHIKHSATLGLVFIVDDNGVPTHVFVTHDDFEKPVSDQSATVQRFLKK